MRPLALAVALLAFSAAAPLSSLTAQQGPARYGDIVLGDEEAFLDLQMDATTAWSLLRRDLGDSAQLLPESVLSDTWLVVDDLWLRLEPLPYRSGSWVRVRVRVGDMHGGDEQQRAEGLLVRLALALDVLRGAPAPAAPAPPPAPVMAAPVVVSQPVVYGWVPYGVLFSGDWLANSWWVGSGGQVSLSVYIQQEPTYWWGWHVFDPFWHHHYNYWYFDHWYSHHGNHWNWYDGYGWGHPAGCGCCNGGGNSGDGTNGGGDDGGGGGGNGGGGNGGGPLNPRIANYRKSLDVSRDLAGTNGGVVAYGGAGAGDSGPRSVRPTRSSVGRQSPRIVSSSSSIRLQPLPRGTSRLGTIETVGFGRGTTSGSTPSRSSAPWTAANTSRTSVTRSIGSPVPDTPSTSMLGRSSSLSTAPVVTRLPSSSVSSSSRGVAPTLSSRSSVGSSSRSSGSSSSRSTPRASSSSSSRSSSSSASRSSGSSSSRGGSSSAGRSGGSSGGRSSGRGSSGGGGRGGRGGRGGSD